MQPYLLKETPDYKAWREQKLNNYPKCAEELIIELNNPIKLVDNEIKAILSACAKTNMAFYRCSPGNQNVAQNVVQKDAKNGKLIVISLAQQLGLDQLDANVCSDEDRISAIQDSADNKAQHKVGRKAHYIPYTKQALNWHTDGYYNTHQQRIHAFLMHCVRPAKSGGENSFLDPEIAYILIRDENPDYIAALMDARVMTIPANEIAGKVIRAEQTGPVFFVDDVTQTLYMRYTARQRNIIWKQDKIVQKALAFMQEILQGNSYMFHYSLKAGEGVICNNVLHNRTAFEDHQEASKKRLLYRGRFYNRIAMHINTLEKVVNH